MKLKKVKQGEYVYYYRPDETKKYEHYKDSDGFEWWAEYDKQGKEIHFKNSDGYERWAEYNKQGKEIHFKNSEGYERWSDDNPDKPNVKVEFVDEKDINAFEFA